MCHYGHILVQVNKPAVHVFGYTCHHKALCVRVIGFQVIDLFLEIGKKSLHLFRVSGIEKCDYGIIGRAFFSEAMV